MEQISTGSRWLKSHHLDCQLFHGRVLAEGREVRAVSMLEPRGAVRGQQEALLKLSADQSVPTRDVLSLLGQPERKQQHSRSLLAEDS